MDEGKDSNPIMGIDSVDSGAKLIPNNSLISTDHDNDDDGNARVAVKEELVIDEATVSIKMEPSEDVELLEEGCIDENSVDCDGIKTNIKVEPDDSSYYNAENITSILVVDAGLNGSTIKAEVKQECTLEIELAFATEQVVSKCDYAMELDDQAPGAQVAVPEVDLKGNEIWGQKQITEKHPNSCGVCNESFWTEDDLRCHMLIHFSRRPYQCYPCHEEFKSKKFLADHMMVMHTEDISYNCGGCGQHFTRKCHLSAHIVKEHTRRKPDKSECKLCNVRFKDRRRKEKLDRHVTSQHIEVKPNRCKLCSKEFLSLKPFKNHMMKNHANDSPPYKCSVCNLIMPSQRDLRQHISSVHSELPFHCFICDRRFALESDFRKHITTHSSQLTQIWQENTTKPVLSRYACNVCFFSMNQKTDILRHIKKTHQKRETFFCNSCRLAIRSGDIQRHMRDKHVLANQSEGTPIVCGVCDVKFEEISALRTHWLTHPEMAPYQCMPCALSFPCSETLKVHTLLHTVEYPYPCYTCSHRFREVSDLKMHCRAIHTGKTTYQCNVCSAWFFSRIPLNEHTVVCLSNVKKEKEKANVKKPYALRNSL